MNDTGYKWMFCGNASTTFFPEAALQLLEDFDPRLPYIVTDDLLWKNASGAAMPDEAPRCLPCHFDDAHELLRLSQGKDCETPGSRGLALTLTPWHWHFI